MQNPDLLQQAIEHTQNWAQTVAQQAKRIEAADSLSDINEHPRDADLLILALRNVVRAAKFARDVAPGEGRKGLIDATLSEFDASFPDAKDIRDIIEHFDAYTQGVGNLQKKGGVSAESPFIKSGITRAPDKSSYVVSLAGKRINVMAAPKLAWSLAYAVSGIDPKTVVLE
jgi:hypothetical protein